MVLYDRDHVGLVFSPKNIMKKSASLFLYNSLAQTLPTNFYENQLS